MRRMFFVILAVAFSTNLPSPIFPLYQAAYGMSTASITVLFGIYAAGVLLMLLASGALAERVGPRAVALAGVGLAIVSALMFMTAGSPGALYAARCVGGVAVGAFLGTSNTLLLQMTTPERRGRVLGLSSTLNLFGFGLGPALGATWVRALPGDPMRAPFAVLALVLAAALLTLLSVRAGREKTPSAGGPLIRFGIPASGRGLFWGAVGPAVFSGFAFGGIAFALLPGIARTVFGAGGRGVGGFLVFLMTTVGALAQLVRVPASPRARLSWGLAVLIAGSWVVMVGETLGLPAVVLAAAVLQGVGNGWAFQASLQLAGEVAVQGDRVQVMSTYFLCGYAGLSLPVIAAGELSRGIGVLPSEGLATVFLSALVVVAFLFVRRGSQRPTT